MTAGGPEVLMLFKDLAGARGPAMGLRVGDPPVAFLRTVAGRRDRSDPADIAALTTWRNRHVTAFLTEFEATDERTAAWLESTAEDGSRVLFMVDDLAGRTFGYMGLAAIDWTAKTGEADAIVRGEPTAAGTMSASMLALIDWATGPLGLQRIFVRVRSDNPALTFYQRLGFVEQRRIPLRLQQTAGITKHWVEDEAADSELFLVHLELEGAIA
jgi:RimJ/RimL family protein N-acetyltransferase